MKQLLITTSILAISVFYSNSIFAQGPPKKGKRPTPKELIKKLDVDKDGKISFAEAQAMERGPLKKDFKKIDADGDGLLTLKELKARKPRKKGKKLGKPEDGRN